MHVMPQGWAQQQQESVRWRTLGATMRWLRLRVAEQTGMAATRNLHGMNRHRAALPRGGAAGSTADITTSPEPHMNAFHFKGHVQTAAGRAREIAGRIVGSQPLQDSGRAAQEIGRALVDRGDRREQFRRIAEAHIQ